MLQRRGKLEMRHGQTWGLLDGDSFFGYLSLPVACVSKRIAKAAVRLR